MSGKSRTRNMKENAEKVASTRNRTRDPLLQISRLSEQALLEAEDAIASRKELTQRFLKEIEKEIAEAVRMLRLLGEPWKHGDKTEYEFMRISLDKALTARKKERRERLLQSWKDLLDLMEKKRDLIKENLAFQGVGRSGKRRKNNITDDMGQGQ